MKRSNRTGPARDPLSKALRYGLCARSSDWWNGRRDGRLGHPEVTSAEIPITPTVSVLRERFEDRVAAEELIFHLTTAPSREKIAELLRVEHQATGHINECEKLLAEPSPEFNSADADRRAGEAMTDQAVVTARRTREHNVTVTARRRGIEQKRDTAIAEAERAAVEIDKTAEAVRSEHRALQARSKRLLDFTNRRFRCYQRPLVRRHPEGARLIPVLQAMAPEVPAHIAAELSADDVINDVKNSRNRASDPHES